METARHCPLRNGTLVTEHSFRNAEFRAENATLRAKLESVRTKLDAALGEAQRPALAACRRPSGAIDDGTCQACGTEVC
jgi:hypothetical protein